MTVLALTGVPGTGKTTAAEQLPDRVLVVDARELAHEVGAVTGRDDERESEIADETVLAERARDHLPEGDVVVEGVLAHHCHPDRVVVLRCHPDELRRRLAQRGWPEHKIEENVMAETLDAIVAEVATEPAWELDTTELSPEAVAEHIVGLFTDEDLDSGKVGPLGGVDWTDTLMDEDPP